MTRLLCGVGFVNERYISLQPQIANFCLPGILFWEMIYGKQKIWGQSDSMNAIISFMGYWGKTQPKVVRSLLSLGYLPNCEGSNGTFDLRRIPLSTTKRPFWTGLDPGVSRYLWETRYQVSHHASPYVRKFSAFESLPRHSWGAGGKKW